MLGVSNSVPSTICFSLFMLLYTALIWYYSNLSSTLSDKLNYFLSGLRVKEICRREDFVIHLDIFNSYKNVILLKEWNYGKSDMCLNAFRRDRRVLRFEIT